MPSKKLCELAPYDRNSREGSPITVEIKVVKHTSRSPAPGGCPLTPYDTSLVRGPDRGKLAAQRWIADGDAPLPREFKKMSDLADFLATCACARSSRATEAVDKQRASTPIAAIAAPREPRRAHGLPLPEPQAGAASAGGAARPHGPGAPPARAVDRSARRAGELDHHWIPRLRAAGVAAGARRRARGDRIGIGATSGKFDEVRGIKDVERDRADAEAKAMAQNDPAVLAWLRAEVEKVVRPPRPGMPPDRIDHITQSITQALLDATSAERQA